MAIWPGFLDDRAVDLAHFRTHVLRTPWQAFVAWVEGGAP